MEDNADDDALSVRALKTNGVLNEVVVARDGVQATDFLIKTGHYAERRLQDLPVVVLTSSIEESGLTSSYTLGANSHLRKPVDFDELMEAVRQLEAYWLSLNQSPPISRPVA